MTRRWELTELRTHIARLKRLSLGEQIALWALPIEAVGSPEEARLVRRKNALVVLLNRLERIEARELARNTALPPAWRRR